MIGILFFLTWWWLSSSHRPRDLFVKLKFGAHCLKSVSVGQNFWNCLGQFKVHGHFVSPSRSLTKIWKNTSAMMPIFKHLIFHTEFSVNVLGFNLSLQLLVNQKLKDWNLVTQFMEEARENDLYCCTPETNIN